MKSLYESILSSTNTGRVSLIRALREWLDEYGVKNYTINGKLEIDVDGDVDLMRKRLKEFPSFIQFGIVKGNFDCSYNNLTHLRGAPKVVVGDFDCRYNNLTTLEGAPEKVVGDFYCSGNNLTSLKGAPENVGRDFVCGFNKTKFTDEYVNKVCNVKGKIRHI